MDARQELPVQRKREHETREETTIPARVFVPTADIFESKDALMVVLEMPGVDKSNVDVRVEDGVLNVQGRLDLSAAPHSITSSARVSTVAGTSRPSVLAVLRLITNSYFVGACTGRSAGFSPLRMRSA
jgi:hypothetical protein